MPVTAKDVARELGLSQSTVSRILNGDAQYRVAADTRGRVLDTARRLGYQPNAVARSLRRGRTNIIGVYTNHDYDVRNDFMGTIVGSLQRECEPRNLDLLLHSALHDQSSGDVYGKLRDGRIDGLILHASSDDPLVAVLGNSSLPVVSVADLLPHLSGVTSDDADGMSQLIHYLWERSYRCYVYLEPKMPLGSVERRKSAFLANLKNRGLPNECMHVIGIDFEQTDPVLQRLTMLGPGVAVCCWNDRTAYGLLKSCLDNGIPVPEQMAIAGFDGFISDKIPARELVTIACPWEQVATSAVSLLMQRIESKASDSRKLPPSEICLPVKLLPGDTA